jgi:uncharacterized protein YktA (UPF0223 family)
MTTHQKIVLIEKYRRVLATLSEDLLAYLKTNKMKRTQLMTYLRAKNPSLNEMTNVAFYEKIKGPTRWRYEEILLVLEFMNAREKKKVVIQFYHLIKEEVKGDINNSPFQFTFLATFLEKHFDFSYESVQQYPIRWRYNLEELLEVYRLLEHVEKFKRPNKLTSCR